LSHPYEQLTPELILDAIERAGLMPSGHVLALNSYENRVFQVGIEDQAPMVAKFYRPQRWSDAQILEEHEFALELAEAEIPMVAPWRAADGSTLFHHGGFRYALFPRRGGRAPEPGDFDQMEWIGRFIGRIHLAGRVRPFRHRPALDTRDMGWTARANVLDSPLLPDAQRQSYAAVSETLLAAIEQVLDGTGFVPLRLHGDCHHGNILWTDQGPHFVDLDDCRNGPAVQDLWMLLTGGAAERSLQLDAMLEGYRTFCDFDPRELALIEPLRGLRMIHYAGWLAHRWTDPAFPAAFPWAGSDNYWAQHVQDLHNQIEALAEPPLTLY
jgi:Ser/Thr protein kinase RdoA (MazF antagonist)